MKWKVAELPDEAFSSSSDFNRNHAAKLCRLNSAVAGKANWSAKTIDQSQWLQVDLGSIQSVVAVAVQGRHNMDQWVIRLDLQLSTDLKSWSLIENATGAQDRNTINVIHLPQPTDARYVRFIPKDWYNHISMRVDVATNDIVKSVTLENVSSEKLIETNIEVPITKNSVDSASVNKNINSQGGGGVFKFDRKKFKDVYTVLTPLSFDSSTWLLKISEEILYRSTFESEIALFLSKTVLSELKFNCEWQIKRAKKEIPELKKDVKNNPRLQNFLNTYQYMLKSNTSMLKLIDKQLKNI